MQAPCGICKGRLGAIRYDEPSNAQHPLSFVIDEVIPVSKWKQYGYESARAAAEDFNNLQAAHYICNQLKSNRTDFTLTAETMKQQAKAKQQEQKQATSRKIFLDGKW